MEPPKLGVRAAGETDLEARADNDLGETTAPPQSPSRSKERGKAGASRSRSTARTAVPVEQMPAASPQKAEVEAVAPAAASNIAALPSADRGASLRIVEALLFAAAEPLDEAFLARHLKGGTDIAALLDELRGFYSGRGVNLVRVAGKWAFRTAEDLGYLLERHAVEERKLSRAALETLAIVAYHQPVTRAEIEEIRGVETSKGTIDILLETGWVRPRGRRRAPGKPLTFGTTEAFLDHFSMQSIKDLPGLADLKGAGLLDATLPADFKVPEPTDVAALMPDELPLDDEPEAEQVELDIEPAGEDEADDDSTGAGS